MVVQGTHRDSNLGDVSRTVVAVIERVILVCRYYLIVCERVVHEVCGNIGYFKVQEERDFDIKVTAR
jgi:hypothetical protein